MISVMTQQGETVILKKTNAKMVRLAIVAFIMLELVVGMFYMFNNYNCRFRDGYKLTCQNKSNIIPCPLYLRYMKIP